MTITMAIYHDHDHDLCQVCDEPTGAADKAVSAAAGGPTQPTEAGPDHSRR